MGSHRRALWAWVFALLLTHAARAGDTIDDTPVVDTIVCTGRVVVAEGTPAGAEVVAIPSDATRKALGFDTPALGYGVGVRHGAFADGAEVTDTPPWAVVTPVGADGGFRFELPHVYAVYEQPAIVVRKPGCMTRQVTTRLHFGTATGRLDLGAVGLAPESRLSGRLVDAGGAPLAGAVVRRAAGALAGLLETSLPAAYSDAHVARTDADGRFALRGFEAPSSKSYVLVDHPLAPPSTRLGHPAVHTGRHVDLGDVVVDTGLRLRGRVVDGHGRPVPGAEVCAGPDPRRSLGYCPEYRLLPSDDTVLQDLAALPDTTRRVVTDGRGAFDLPGVARDLTRLYVDAEGFAPRRVGFDAIAEITLEPERVLRVSVVDGGTGEPLPSATVTARRSASEALDWHAAPVPAERVAAGLWHVRRAGANATALDVVAPGHGRVVVLAPGATPGEPLDFEVRLPRHARLHGRVLDPAGRPVPGAAITLQTTGRLPGVRTGREPLRATTDEAGRFAFDELTPEELALNAWVEGSPPWTGAPVLRAGETTDLDVTLQAHAELVVHVRDRDGRPTSGVRVECRGTAGGWREHESLATNAAGETHLRLVPGRYLLGSPTSLTHEVMLGSGEQRVLMLVEGSRPRLHVRLTHRGEPVAERDFMLHAPEGAPYTRIEPAQLRTDPRGELTVALPAVGRWSLRSRKLPLLRSEFEVAAHGVHELQLALPEHALRGRLVDQDGRPVERTVVHCVRGEEVVGAVSSDDDGRFHLPWLDAGPARLAVQTPGHPSEHVVVVTDGHAEPEEITVAVDLGARLVVEVAGGLEALLDEHGASAWWIALRAARERARTVPLLARDGDLSSGPVTPGAYTLVVSRRQERASSGRGPGRAIPLEVVLERDVTLTSGETLVVPFDPSSP